MEPLAITLGNLLVTFWIAGGFLALLFLVREDPATEAVPRSAQPPAEAESAPEVPRPVPMSHRPQAVRDVYWERRRMQDLDRPEEAA